MDLDFRPQSIPDRESPIKRVAHQTACPKPSERILGTRDWRIYVA